MKFASLPLDRHQAVLFPERLDQAIPDDHAVRLLDELLGRIDWTPFNQNFKPQAADHKQRGRPPIAPRIIASVILYGILRRIHSSRDLEEALTVRLDFRWLVHGTKLDHSTICDFRVANGDALKDLFVQIVSLARQMGFVPLSALGYDGTKMRANNRRSGTRTPQQLRQQQRELTELYDQAEKQATQLDDQQAELFDSGTPNKIPESLSDIAARKAKIDEAVAELDRIKDAGLKEPARLPITDPHSRVGKNKDGGFAPNHTPTATVDTETGIVVDSDVISGHHEDRQMLGSIDRVTENYGLEHPPEKMLADGLMSSGENIVGCKDRGVDLFSPIKLRKHADNPALREDPTKSVDQEKRKDLPRRTVSVGGKKVEKLDKEAFVYDAAANHYRCPQGEILEHRGTTTEKENGREVIRHRFESDAAVCAQCPLVAACINAKTGVRQVRHTEHEAARIEHAEKMSAEKAQTTYSRRRHPGERPFAMIKQHFGIRQFSVRGLCKVRQQWDWLMSAFNLHRVMHLIQSNPDPPAAAPAP